jgi:hypothetical protein
MKSRYFIDGDTVKLSKGIPNIKQKRERENRSEEEQDIRRALQSNSASNFLREEQS